MKKLIFIFSFLLIGLVSSAQDPEQWLPGLTKMDTAQFRLMTAAPSVPVSGYLVNVNGYAFWWDGFAWDTLQSGGVGGGGGVTVHGGLTGLAADDHTHYYNLARLNSWFGTKSHTDLLGIGSNTHTQIDVHLASTTNPHAVVESDILAAQSGMNGRVYTSDGANGYWAVPASGVTDHGLLNGLGDDDHTIYHTDSRASIWFTSQNISNLGFKSHISLTDIGVNTHIQIDAAVSASTSHIANTSNPHSVTHGALPDLTNDDHTQYTLRTEWLQNGFVDTADIDLSWDDGSRTLTIEPASSTFDYFIAGIRYTASGAVTETITDTEGTWAFYFDSEGSITSVNEPSHTQIDNVIDNYCIMAYVYWDADNNDGRLMTELHGYRMSPGTHHWIHDNIGSVYKHGMAMADFVTDASGDVNTHAQFSVATGAFYDEDIGIGLSAVASTTGLEIWYLDGTDWRWTTNSGYSILTAGTGRMAYNNSGAQTEISNNDFGLCHIFATNIVADDGTDPKYIAIQGQDDYLTLGQARTGAEVEINNLVYGSLPLQELIPVGTIIFQTGNGYSNAVKSRVRTTDGGDDYVDWRSSNLKASGGSISDHGSLAGLADDDHTQYHNDARAATWLALQSILDLADTPASFSGQGEKVLAVNVGETAMEFVEQTGGGTGSTLISTTACDYNDTTYITIGDTTDLGFKFRYEAKRDITTQWAQSGDIDLVYDSIAGTVSYGSSYVGTDIGLDIQADKNAGNLRLMLIVDNVNTNNLTFNLHTSFYSDVDTIVTNDPAKAISYTDCPDNDTTYIVLGTYADVAYRVHYIAERNLVPARKQSGNIDILYDDVAGTVSYFNDYIGTDLGLDVQGRLNSGNIELMIIVDNINTNNLLFDHRITSKFYE